MSNQNPYYYVDEKNSAERGEEIDFQNCSSDKNTIPDPLNVQDQVDSSEGVEEGNNNSSTNKNVPPTFPNQDKINKPSVGLKMAIDELRAVINAQEKKQTTNNSSDKNHNHEEQKIVKGHPISASLPQERKIVKDQPVSSSLPQEQKSCSILTATPAAPPQSNAHADTIPKTDSSRVESPDHHAKENIHPATKVNNNETKEGWGWSAAQGLISVGWSVARGLISVGWSVVKGAVELFSLLRSEMQFGILASMYTMWKFYKLKEKTKDNVKQLFRAGHTAAKFTGEKLGLAAKFTGEKLKVSAQKVQNLACETRDNVVKSLQGEFKPIALEDAKRLIQEGKNDELAKYLIYENQITMDESGPSAVRIEVIEDSKTLNTDESVISEEPVEEKKLEDPEPKPEQNTPHRQLLEEAIACHNLGAVKLLLKHGKSVIKEAVIGKICNVLKDSEAKFQGVNIKGDQALLSQAMVKLFDLRSSLSQLELSHSFVGTTQEVTLENIGQVEIAFKKIDEDSYWMQAKCLVNKGKNDEYSIEYFFKIAAKETQITNGESSQVNVLESDEFQKFLTTSINDYHDSLHIIDYLLKQGADPNEMEKVRNLQYDIPLQEALYKKNSELFVVLLKNQAKPSKELIEYAFRDKDPHSGKKTFYKLLSEPHCNSAGVQLWESFELLDTVQSGDNVTNKTHNKLLTMGNDTKKLDVRVLQTIYQNKCTLQAELEQNQKELPTPVDESYSGNECLPQLPSTSPATQPENNKISPPSIDEVKTQSPSADGQNLDGHRLFSDPNQLNYHNETLKKPLAPQGYPSLQANPSSKQIVIHNSKKKAQVTHTSVNGNTYHPQSKNMSGMTPLTFNTPPSPESKVDNQEIATTQKNSDNMKTTTAQPLGVRQSQETRQEIAQLPEKVNNSPSTPSSQDSPVVIVSQKNIILSKSHSRKLYSNFSPKERIDWKKKFAAGIIIESLKLNDISEVSKENLAIGVENLLKIMNNEKTLEKFMGDIMLQAENSNSNHQNPLLQITFSEGNSRELSSNPQMLSVSQQKSCLWLLDQFFLYIAVTNPLLDSLITCDTTQQLNQEYQQELKKNRDEKALFDKFGQEKSNLRDLWRLVQYTKQNGLQQAHFKAIFGGKSLPEIIWHSPKTTWSHVCKLKRVTINSLSNLENIIILRDGLIHYIVGGSNAVRNSIKNTVNLAQNMMQVGNFSNKSLETTKAEIDGQSVSHSDLDNSGTSGDGKENGNDNALPEDEGGDPINSGGSGGTNSLEVSEDGGAERNSAEEMDGKSPTPSDYKSEGGTPEDPNVDDGTLIEDDSSGTNSLEVIEDGSSEKSEDGGAERNSAEEMDGKSSQHSEDEGRLENENETPPHSDNKIEGGTPEYPNVDDGTLIEGDSSGNNSADASEEEVVVTPSVSEDENEGGDPINVDDSGGTNNSEKSEDGELNNDISPENDSDLKEPNILTKLWGWWSSGEKGGGTPASPYSGGDQHTDDDKSDNSSENSEKYFFNSDNKNDGRKEDKVGDENFPPEDGDGMGNSSGNNSADASEVELVETPPPSDNESEEDASLSGENNAEEFGKKYGEL